MRYFVKMALIAGLLAPVAEDARADSTSDAVHRAVNDKIDVADAPVAIEIVYEPALPATLAGSESPVALKNFRFDQMSGRFSAIVMLPNDGAETSIAGYAKATVEVPVLRRSLQRGEVIADDDVDYVTLPASSLPKGLMLDPSQLAGKAARRTLHADKAVRASDLMAPILVAKNSSVAMIYVVGALKITARGRALSDGGQGETVLVLNTSSKKTVEAVVLNANTVSVGQPPQPLQP
jgi:flagellar basal body P-ring formation protein FlgA